MREIVSRFVMVKTYGRAGDREADLVMAGKDCTHLDWAAAWVRALTEADALLALLGFTQEDVDRHRGSADKLTWQLDAQGPTPEWDFPQEEIDGKTTHRDWHLSMSTRIEALLPPEVK